ncbi:MAG: hypothetical protein PUF50_01765 [Erysipelotrichaceae bacterium]|nr:hypothetical protein [Erysipelotrichaceae bacterium]
MKKIIKYLLCVSILFSIVTLPVFAENGESTEIFIVLDVENPEGYSRTFVDEENNMVKLEVSPIEETPTVLRASKEELGYGTYTRTASLSYTESTSRKTAKMSFKFKATISTTSNPRLHSISNITFNEIMKHQTYPVKPIEYATSTADAFYFIEADADFGNSITMKFRLRASLSYSEILTITTSKFNGASWTEI